MAAALEDLPDEQLTDTSGADIVGLFRVTRAALPHLAPGSTIINTSSVVAYMAPPNLLNYASTGAGIDNSIGETFAVTGGMPIP